MSLSPTEIWQHHNSKFRGKYPTPLSYVFSNIVGFFSFGNVFSTHFSSLFKIHFQGMSQMFPSTRWSHVKIPFTFTQTGDLPPDPFTFNSTGTINGLMAPCMLCSVSEGQWVYFSFLSSPVLWSLLWEQNLVKHSCLQSESSQNTDAAQILSFHRINTEDYCEMQYPFSNSTLLGMRKATATHAGGNNFFKK